MEPEPSTPLGTVYVILAGLLGTGLLGLMAFGGAWLAQQAKSSRTYAVVSKAFEVAQSIVSHVDATLRPQLQSALQDGQITPLEAAKLKGEALRLFREALGEAGLKQLGRALGLAPAAVETHMSGVLERALLAKKAVEAVPFVPSR